VRGKRRAADTVIRHIVTPCRSRQASFKKDAEQNRNKQTRSGHSTLLPLDDPEASADAVHDREIFHRPNGKRWKLTCDADLHRLLEIV
jgi:hypothetical protein